MATTAPAGMASDALVESRAGGLTRSGAVRIATIDVMRGLVIAIMVLDHVRDYFHVDAFLFDPTDATRTGVALYLTRWVTHLCAPTFVLLSGVSIYLQKANGKTGGDLARFLVTRGLWLVLLECTVVTVAWNFAWPFVWLFQIIWAIGWSMVAMALLAYLPARWVLAIGIALVALSPFALPPQQASPTELMISWHLLFGGTFLPGANIFIAYAIVPWLGVMAIGFGLGPLFARPPAGRRRSLLIIGAMMVAAFVVLRSLNGYGDPEPWTRMSDPLRTVMSFFDVTKYPPSPDFVLVTLGLALPLFCAIERLRGPLARILGDFGRTPLFTYVAHLYIAHGLMLAMAAAMGRPEVGLYRFQNAFGASSGPPWGVSLGVVYLMWVVVLALLVPLSRWMAAVKRRRRDWWLSYV